MRVMEEVCTETQEDKAAELWDAVRSKVEGV